MCQENPLTIWVLDTNLLKSPRGCSSSRSVGFPLSLAFIPAFLGFQGDHSPLSPTRLEAASTAQDWAFSKAVTAVNKLQKRVCLNHKEKSINKGYFERLAMAGDCVGAGGSDEFSLPEGETLPR
ncbi:ceroid-lipofuscinosis neuronal protein 5 [Platysternon megacephalum]|uniref:Ceroid-lipofuscinosis neuronal protein 5 n=1 Tax=Platysternon megacephalum TaxID=55544 RepID=A0A4D9DY46_9SAUR|nr:ceroid-lipofuscinosis neuronal protein 5 [Platysternon megacephalum]